MATSSFLKNVVIKDTKQFVDALSESVRKSENERIEISRPCHELKGEEIREFFGVNGNKNCKECLH